LLSIYYIFVEKQKKAIKLGAGKLGGARKRALRFRSGLTALRSAALVERINF
jgi:hypothetical protein